MSVLVPLVLALTTPLGDPRQEARAQALEQEIRCVVCENEPISQSTAEIAGDMRALVRERIQAGDSDAEIRAYFSERYGDFVLLRPGFEGNWALWLAPALLALAGLGVAATLRARRDEPLAPDLQSDDR